MEGFLLINPRSGDERPSAEELASAAAQRGLETHVLRPGEDVGAIARAARTEPLGIAGGDGSLAAVAEATIDAGARFVCVPFGTRNHFARDLGLDPGDPLGALDAFDGVERRVDVGRVGERVFLNNVSLGLYARLVHRRERHRRRRDALARVRALVLLARERGRVPTFSIDGERVSAPVVLVASNAYELQLFNVGTRRRLDDGLVHLYIAHGTLPRSWEERSSRRFRIAIAAGGRVAAAIDGEPAWIETPVEFTIEPTALRVLVPRPPE